MKLPLYIAKRYLFAKKSRNAINVISGVSAAGVAVGTMALIIILSVFNGLELLVTAIFNTFDPDLKITAAEGKTFIPDSTKLYLLSATDGIACYSLTLEENAYLKYGDREYIGTIKGVDENYTRVTGIDSTIWEGEFLLSSENRRSWAVPGLGVANFLGIRVNFITPLFIYVPRKSAGSSLDYENAFVRKYIFPSGIFQIEQTYDSKYVYLPLDFTRELIQEEKGVSSIEIKLNANADANRVRKNVNNIFGDDHVIQNRYEQQEIFYKVMRSERLAIFMILTLIIVIASFNIVGSLTMLIIEKERDIEILR
ncbi:MAG: ABC transporter permease, partial [Bacteroidales bacterium]|nr:ABC transporter permease [Bacteroidales bacterium]